jgi:outer membrane biosynthesis protein TonB
MNPIFTLEHDIPGQRPSRLMAGLALSLVLHAGLLFAWRHGRIAPQPVAATRTSIAVRLLPPPPPPPPPKAEPPPRASASTPAPAAKLKRRVAPDVIAVQPPPTPAAPAPPDAFTVEPPAPQPPPPSSAPHFDPDAARKLARQLANEPDPAKADTALARLPAKRLENETKAARAISQAKRPDCKDGLPGGLLAPLFLLMDKKDSGCKW